MTSFIDIYEVAQETRSKLFHPPPPPPPPPSSKNGGEVRCNFTQHRASFKRNLQMVPP